MTKGRPRPATMGTTADQPFVRMELGLLLAAAFTVSVVAWMLPLEVAQQWALDRAAKDPYARFEAVGGAEFSIWILRFATSLLLIPLSLIWWHGESFRRWCAKVNRGWLRTTQFCSADPTTVSCRLRTLICRVILAGWMVLFLAHVVTAYGQCRREWPYFRFNSGNVVLPNISEANRAVIRYVQQATPENARILVASDQKLFFLSYYLRPRVLLHRMHPDSEHVIPLKDQLRKLSAYQLSDLSESDLQQLPHNFTLEYFEHPDLVDRAQVLADPQWLSFIRQRERDPSLVPSYLVRLRKTEEKLP